MIEPRDFFALLKKNGIAFFAGVPDSLLKNFCAFLLDNCGENDNIITANEGGAMALAAGHYLATGRPALVYMQNSGLGNSVNPLLSLCDPDVYSIPALLLVGWRGEPGVKDEPQHVKQGKVTLPLLATCGIEHSILPQAPAEAEKTLEHALLRIKTAGAPFALVVRKDLFAPYEPSFINRSSFEMTREDALIKILERLDSGDIIVSTTGHTSRELFEYRENSGTSHSTDFLTVGSMGHSSHIALGISLKSPGRKVFCVDGDGALLMHMGALAVNGHYAGNNFRHIVINNGAHESVGGQPTLGLKINICGIALACGYKKALSADTADGLDDALGAFMTAPGPSLLEIKVKQGARKNLGRPTLSPAENRQSFMKNLRGEN